MQISNQAIQSSQVTMQASHQYQQMRQRQVSDLPGPPLTREKSTGEPIAVDLSRETDQQVPSSVSGVELANPSVMEGLGASGLSTTTVNKMDIAPMQQGELPPRLLVAKLLLERMSGRTFELFAFDGTASSAIQQPDAELSAANFQQSLEERQWVRVTDLFAEKEQSQFTASGRLQLKDGTEIRFSIGLQMQREEIRMQVQEMTKAQLKDPLVVNLGIEGVVLSEQVQAFDLDGDGVLEQLPAFSSDSAYLVWDRNDNGNIDDGHELFGALSGDGFADLAALDQDGNGFIDRSDPVFEQLALWQPGEDVGRTLADEGILALYIVGIDTPFMLKDKALQQTGAVRQTGVYVNQDGSAGTLQQIDIVV